jgi:bifunctional non-homologous end joining protein LigD
MHPTDHFAVLDYEPEGADGLASLSIAPLAGGDLELMGSVGLGLSFERQAVARRALDVGQPVVVEVEYRGLTPDGSLRHAVVRDLHVGV